MRCRRRKSRGPTRSSSRRSSRGSSVRSTKLRSGTHGYQAIVPHRLNRKEYNNAVHDLLALDVDSAEFLPPDDEVKHFDNIATGLQVSPSFIEQYVIAARAVAVRAVGRPDARTGSQTYTAGPGNQQTHVTGLPLGTRGGMVVKSPVPVGRRVPDQHRRHVHAHLGQRLGVREHRRRHARRQGRLRDHARRRRGHEGATTRSRTA